MSVYQPTMINVQAEIDASLPDGNYQLGYRIIVSDKEGLHFEGDPVTTTAMRRLIRALIDKFGAP